MTDFTISGGGSIFILTPISEAAIDWANEYLPEEAQRWGAKGYVVEHRYIGDIVDSIRGDGMEVS
jgi:hypothetical protein